MKKIILLLVLLLSVQVAKARVDTLMVDVFFRPQSTDVIFSYLNNGRNIQAFVDSVKRIHLQYPEKKLTFEIESGCFICTSFYQGRKLGEERGVAVRNFLSKLLHDFEPDFKVNCTIFNQGVRWGKLYSMIKESNEPWKDEVLSVLASSVDTDETEEDPRFAKLRKLRGGKVLGDLADNYLLLLEEVVIYLIY